MKTIQKIKGGAMMFVGTLLAGNTLYDYFTLGELTRIPRILFPVYNAIGDLATCILTCIIGGAVVYFGVKTWREPGEEA
jgi:hypothetical protein